MRRFFPSAAVLVFVCAQSVFAAPQQQEPVTQPPQEQGSEDVPVVEEYVIVTASRAAEQLLNAPTAVTVVSSETIQNSSALNYADFLRAVPGLNAIQTSARDVNLTSRGATRTTANTQLVLVDGRSVYQDFLGFVLWDALPIEPGEIKQIEVIRGPASAVWGANAMDGVVNIITKSPREIAGSSLSLGVGTFDRNTRGSRASSGALFYAQALHAAAVNDRWSYKVSGGYSAQDALARPTGVIPNAFKTPYPPFQNTGTTTPKVDVQVNYDFPDTKRKLIVAGGVSGSSGIMHTGSGPFQIHSGSMVGYGKMNFSRGDFRLDGFVNFIDGDATSLLSRDSTGQLIPLIFKAQTFDLSASDGRVLRAHHIVRYGGNVRYSNFDLSAAPLGRNRREGGGYLQDQILFNDHVEWVIGGRLDKFGVVDHPVLSPRTALVLKPSPQHAFRLSVNRAFRSPTLINNFLALKLITAIDLGLINPLLEGQSYAFPVDAVGNRGLHEESMTTYEAGYTALLRNRTTLGAAYYVNQRKNSIVFSQVASYGSSNPPPGWPLPPFVLDLLAQAGAGLPSVLMDMNVGRIRDQGLEMSADVGIRPGLNVFANYSWQKKPAAEPPTSEAINLPPTHRFNSGASYSRSRFFSSVAINHVGEALWRDVLDARFHGPTPPFTKLDAGGGVRWAGGKRALSIKASNLTNREIQQHIFGDIIKRQITAELRLGL